MMEQPVMVMDEPILLTIKPGSPLPYGATVTPEGINFSIYSRSGTACTLVLFRTGQIEPLIEIPVPAEYRIGDVFPILVQGLDPDDIEYGFRIDGPWDPENGNRFDPGALLIDPYAKSIGGRDIWGKHFDPSDAGQHRARIVTNSFDWGEDRPLGTPTEDLIIYEMHVRGFTKHLTAGVRNPGTYDAIREKIPYLKELGINAIELMPIFEFDEYEHARRSPVTGELLLNYWGYSPVSFFAPKAGYAASNEPGGEVDELKALIKDLHANGIEVILDVVYNHTAEGNERGPTFSFKGIDDQIYYLLTPEGYYYNFSGTGNTFNCNHPRVRQLILDSLRYWVSDYHIDGFRFDLASILMRDTNGLPLDDPPLLREMAADPILGRTKLIAEPWDADGLYQLGSFPGEGRWSEWNGHYRDTLRKWLKGDEGQASAVGQVMQGSPRLYRGRGPIASVNFITAHDGFTLMDLVSYNEKHNESNLEGENGANDNHSWNHGVEGPTDDPAINALRRRQVKNAAAMLLLSQGVPMLLMGDELGRSQVGNNNAYCQDSEVSWLNWWPDGEQADLFVFFRRMIEFRRRHPALRNGYFLRGEDYNELGCPDITWHGMRVGKPNWRENSHTLAFMLCGAYAKGGLAEDDDIYVAMNMHWKDHIFQLPEPREGRGWHIFANTGDPAHESHEPGWEPWLEDQAKIRLKARSVAILVGK